VADQDSDAAVPESKSSGGLAKSLMSGVGIFVAVVLAQIVSQPITRMIYGDPNAASETSEPGDEGVAGVEAPIDPANLEPALYVPLDPALVVSLMSASGESHFLQVNVQAMSRDQDSADAIRDHAPALRNSFLFVISKYAYEDVLALDGKEALRQAMLAEGREVMRKNTGVPGVEELYFTSFVVQ